MKDEQIKKLKQKIGDLVMDIDILKEAVKRHPPGGLPAPFGDILDELYGVALYYETNPFLAKMRVAVDATGRFLRGFRLCSKSSSFRDPMLPP